MSDNLRPLPNHPPSGYWALPGWAQVVSADVAYLDEVDPGWRVYEVREKLARLEMRVAVINDPEIHARVEEICDRAQHVCDVCGREGRLQEGEWLRVRCDEHARLHWRAGPTDYPVRVPGPGAGQRSDLGEPPMPFDDLRSDANASRGARERPVACDDGEWDADPH
ncbi:hypothetical protein [Nocardioides litoris]|uniref:hypothetical protein n=1 Tax=Nocardioides litoris TaxID=1926648 RepID=UPI0011231EA0|nr:hypothetical protein [Nocardioides litoris]